MLTANEVRKVEHPCEIIRDLIPVYIQGEASEKTAEVIDQHVKECIGK